ncbi:MAG TPA: xanthine dehydrogenase molybdopterin binding subunit, partial [Bauldia sp.]|nr:xanthine dehydrogenase molybdopterin binding subunit [Bauldia sp.]
MDLADIISGSPKLTVVRTPAEHDSAVKHVTGQAVYIDDIREPVGTLHAAAGYAPIASGRVSRLDLEAVKKAPGVVAVLTAADIPGVNDISPKGLRDDPAIASDRVNFYGQVLFLVVAETREAARKAARLGKAVTAPTMPVIDVDDALVSGTTVLPDYQFLRGDPPEEIAKAPKEITGGFRIGG